MNVTPELNCGADANVTVPPTLLVIVPPFRDALDGANTPPLYIVTDVLLLFEVYPPVN